MKYRYPTEKDLMAALRARSPRHGITAAGTKVRSKAGAKRRTGARGAFPVCVPYFS